MIYIFKTKIICLLMLFILMIGNVSFATTIVNNNSPKIGPFIDKSRTLIVAGDSYAGYFIDFEDNKDFVLYQYALAGQTVIENREMMLKACKAEPRYLLISIGVNDHYKETLPYEFEKIMRECINSAISNGKIVFLHSYVDYPISKLLKRKFSTMVYDDILKRLSTEFENVYYIEMHDMQGLENAKSDNIHYVEPFYDTLYNRVIDCIKKIELLEYGVSIEDVVSMTRKENIGTTASELKNANEMNDNIVESEVNEFNETSNAKNKETMEDSIIRKRIIYANKNNIDNNNSDDVMERRENDLKQISELQTENVLNVIVETTLNSENIDIIKIEDQIVETEKILKIIETTKVTDSKPIEKSTNSNLIDDSSHEVKEINGVTDNSKKFFNYKKEKIGTEKLIEVINEKIKKESMKLWRN